MLIVMNETKITPRQKYIINLVNEKKGVGRTEIEQKVGSFYPASKPTITRDLSSLSEMGVIKIKGKGRSTIYLPVADYPLLARFDLDQYFSFEPDQRVGAKKNFDFTVFPRLISLVTREEIADLENQNRFFSKETSQLDKTIYTRELERFVIEHPGSLQKLKEILIRFWKPKR